MSERRTPAEAKPTLPDAEAIAAALALHGVHGLCTSCGQVALALLALSAVPGLDKPLLLLSCPQCGAVFTYRADVLLGL